MARGKYAPTGPQPACRSRILSGQARFRWILSCICVPAGIPDQDFNGHHNTPFPNPCLAMSNPLSTRLSATMCGAKSRSVILRIQLALVTRPLLEEEPRHPPTLITFTSNDNGLQKTLTILAMLDILTPARNGVIEVDHEVINMIPGVVRTLRSIYRRCLDDPTYVVVIPRPRKPPWSHLASNNQPSPLKQQTQQNRINMSPQEIHSREHDFNVFRMASDQDPYPFDFNQYVIQVANNDSNPFDTTFGGNISINPSLDDFQLLEMAPPQELPMAPYTPHQHDTTKTPASRRRTFDDMTDGTSPDYERKTKVRKNKELQTHDYRACSRPEITSTEESKVATKPSQLATEKLFLCPFYHRDPTKYRKKAWRSCTLPTWTISRLKEHIYRKHFSSHHRCRRCLEEFDNIADLDQHQRTDTPCTKKTRIGDVGKIDETQKAQLQKKSRGITDEEKWMEIYRTVFMLDPKAEVPSPVGKPDDSITLAEFETYLQRHLSNSDSHHSELKIRGCLELMKKFQQTRTTDASDATSDVLSSSYDIEKVSTEVSDSELTMTAVSFNSVGASQEPEIVQPDVLEEFQFEDPELLSRPTDIFALNKSYSFHYPLCSDG